MMMSGKNYFTLAQLNRSIERHLQKVNSSFWIKAEVAQVQFNNGHAYLDLIEKKEGVLLAKNRATIWNSELKIFQHRLKDFLPEILKKGVNILVEITIHYHPVYGLSLQVEDLDESFSIGELERIKKENIEKLQKQGAFDIQKKLKLPLVPQKVAVISSDKAAGYEDFCNQLFHNSYKIGFEVVLFKTKVQGDGASESIKNLLKKIRSEQFDVVAIIRGGGAKIDLVTFDDYLLALEIAHFPIPVLTGIGHERDESIADMVAFQNFKTPTAVANFLVDKVYQYQRAVDDSFLQISNKIDNKITQAKNILKFHVTKTLPSFQQRITQKKYALEKEQTRIIHTITKRIEREKLKLSFTEQFFRTLSTSRDKEKIQRVWEQIQSQLKINIKDERHKLSLLELSVSNKDPYTLLRQGYSMTLKDGKLIDPEQLKKGDKIKTVTNKKIIESTIDKITENL